jgi:L-cysteine S-thiosulfotransferase
MSGAVRTVLALVCITVTVGCAASKPSADSLETPLAAAGDPARGREVFVSRAGGHCVLCHAAPGVGSAGNVGPSLAGVGARLTRGEIRLRIADMPRLNPDAAMPAFHRTEGLVRVAPEYRGKPALSGQQVEDLVAWLATLR